MQLSCIYYVTHNLDQSEFDCWYFCCILSQSGLFFDSRIANIDNIYGMPENAIIQEENLYEPRVPPNPNGTGSP